MRLGAVFTLVGGTVTGCTVHMKQNKSTKREQTRKLQYQEKKSCQSLKGQQRDMVFQPFHSLLVWIERIWKFFEFGLLLTKLGRHCSFGVVGEYAKHAYAPSPTAHNAFFLTNYAQKKNSNVFFNGNNVKFIKYFFKDCPFSFTGSFQSFIFFFNLGQKFNDSLRSVIQHISRVRQDFWPFLLMR